jgi:hypothetical protein
MKKCNYCGYENPTRVKNPRKCPICGNPYNAGPTRKLTGRYLKWGGLFVVLALLLCTQISAPSLNAGKSGYGNSTYFFCARTAS